MDPQPRPDDLAALRATVATLHSRVATQEAEIARLSRRPRHLPRLPRLPRRALPTLLATLLVALVPLATLAAGPGPTFSDLNDAAPVHRPDITAIGAAGISTGFADPNDPTHAIYDPRGVVTREQMASFLARTAGLGANPPIANAKTAQTVPDGSVTAAKLSPQGATTGQVLTATNNGVAWQTVVSGNGPAGLQGPKGDTGPQGPAGTPAKRTIAGAVNADGSKAEPSNRYTVAHNANTPTYTLTFPAGTFSPAPAPGNNLVCLFVPVGSPAYTASATTGGVDAAGAGYQAVTFSAATFFGFICSEDDLPRP